MAMGDRATRRPVGWLPVVLMGPPWSVRRRPRSPDRDPRRPGGWPQRPHRRPYPPAGRLLARTSRPRTRPRSAARCRAPPGRAGGRARRSRHTSPAVAGPVLTMKLACFGLTMAPPTWVPLRPSSSMMRPAESASGLRKTLPADFWPMGWCAWRQRRMSSSRSAMTAGSAATSSKVAATTTSGRPASACFRRVSRYAMPSSSGPRRRFAAIGRDDLGLHEHAAHVRAVRPRVGPHRAAHRAGDGEPELEAGEAGLAGQGGHLGHGQARRPR